MVSTTRTTGLTAEDVWLLPEDERGELIRGELLSVTPVDMDHGGAVLVLGSALLRWSAAGNPGLVGAEIGFAPVGEPGALLAPDVSYYRAAQLPPKGERGGMSPIPPVLAVKVLSPGNSATRIAEKVDLYLLHGVELVWIVDPRRATVVTHTPDGLARRLALGDVLEGGEVLPGFSLSLSELFA